MSTPIAIGSIRDPRNGFAFGLPVSAQSEEFMEKGFAEQFLVDWSAQYCTKTTTFLDIGAFTGNFSCRLAAKCKRVIAIEPSALIREYLATSIAINNLHNITVLPVACSSSKGTTQWVCDTEWGNDGYLTTTLPEVYTRTETVDTITVDSLQLTKLCYINLDVNGHEYEVLQGMVKTLQDNKWPRILIKLVTPELKEKVNTFITTLGYKLVNLAESAVHYLISDHRDWPKTALITINGRSIAKLKAMARAHELSLLTPDERVKIVDGEKYPMTPEQLATKTVFTKAFTWRHYADLALFHFRCRRYRKAYDCIQLGLKIFNSDVAQKYVFYNLLVAVCHFLNKHAEGYAVLDKIVLSKVAVSEYRNDCMGDAGHYVMTLPFVNRIVLDIPENAKLHGYVLSSPSLAKLRTGYKCNIRMVNYFVKQGKYTIFDRKNVVRTSNYVKYFNSKLEPIEAIGKYFLYNDSDVEIHNTSIRGMEDIRLIGGDMFVCTWLEVNENGTPQICLCRHTPNDREHPGAVVKVLPLSVTSTIKTEKNWMPFYWHDQLCVIYSISPLVIYRVDPETGHMLELARKRLRDDLYLNDFRGSAPPMAYKDGWLCTIHQVFYADDRVYHHRFVWFDAEFTTMKFTQLFTFEKVGIEFNLSIVPGTSDALCAMTYSVNDSTAIIIEVEYAVIDKWLEYECVLD